MGLSASISAGWFSFGESLLIPALQATATIKILQYQKDLYDDVSDERIQLINNAVNSYTSAVDAQIASGVFSDAFGTVPTAVLYQAVDIDQESLDTIANNFKEIPEGDRMLAAVNRLHERNDLLRMVALDPRWLCHSEAESVQIKDLLAGKLPVDDIVEVLTDTAEQAALTGRVGNIAHQTMRTLGVSRLRAQAAGRAEMRQRAAMLNRDISPLSRQGDIRSILQTPAQRIALALTQNQLIQQSLQNQANAAAAGDPTEYAKLQVQLQKANNKLGVEAQRGNLINQFVPNYAAILQPQINSITEALRSGDASPIAKPEPSFTQANNTTETYSAKSSTVWPQ